MAREGGGLVCPAYLPKAGSKVDVVGRGTATVLESRPALQTDLYPASPGLRSQQPLPPGLDEGCTLSVQYRDGTTDTISAAEMPKSQFDEALDAYAAPAVLAFYGLVFLSDGGASTTYASNKFDEMETILSDVIDATSPPPDPATAEALALSGEYWGGSAGESDGGDQSVRVTLTFKRGGRIEGRGRDGEDGSYTIPRGRWVREDDGRLWVAWEEKYDEGFRVVCIGHINAATGKVKANFASSRHVTGAFSLAKKPSVF